MFDGTLGTWYTAPFDLELKDDAKPVWLWYYPVPRVKKAIFRKEVDRLVLLGVVEDANDPEWGTPSFAQPNTKIDCIRFFSASKNLNSQLKRKPYAMPKMREIILNLEGLQYATSLCLNVGSYHIRLSKE